MLNTVSFCSNALSQIFAFVSFLCNTTALPYFWGFPAILSASQPFQISIFNSKNSQLTFSNGSQLMGKKVYGKFLMHHWTVHAKVESPRFPPDVRTGGPFHNI